MATAMTAGPIISCVGCVASSVMNGLILNSDGVTRTSFATFIDFVAMANDIMINCVAGCGIALAGAAGAAAFPPVMMAGVAAYCAYVLWTTVGDAMEHCDRRRRDRRTDAAPGLAYTLAQLEMLGWNGTSWDHLTTTNDTASQMNRFAASSTLLILQMELFASLFAGSPYIGADGNVTANAAEWMSVIDAEWFNNVWAASNANSTGGAWITQTEVEMLNLSRPVLRNEQQPLPASVADAAIRRWNASAGFFTYDTPTTLIDCELWRTAAGTFVNASAAAGFTNTSEIAEAAAVSYAMLEQIVATEAPTEAPTASTTAAAPVGPPPTEAPTASTTAAPIEPPPTDAPTASTTVAPIGPDVTTDGSTTDSVDGKTIAAAVSAVGVVLLIVAILIFRRSRPVSQEKENFDDVQGAAHDNTM